jgi:hypothetical protein
MKRLFAFGLSLGLVAALAVPVSAAGSAGGEPSVGVLCLDDHHIHFQPNGIVQQWVNDDGVTWHDTLKPVNQVKPAFKPFDPAGCDSTFTWTVSDFWAPMFMDDAYYVCRTYIPLEAYLANFKYCQEDVEPLLSQ